MLFKLSLLVFAIAILLALIVQLTFSKKISLLNCLTSIITFSLSSFFIKSYLMTGRQPDHNLIKNIFAFYIPVKDSAIEWLYTIQAATLGSYWTARNSFGGQTFFYYPYLPVFYLSLGILVAILILSFTRTSFCSTVKSSTVDVNKINSHAFYILLTSVVWMIGISLSVIFARHVGLEARYYAIPIKLFVISAFLIIKSKSANSIFRALATLLISLFICLYSFIHLSNIYDYLNNAIDENVNESGRSNIGLTHGAPPAVDSKANGELIFISAHPEIFYSSMIKK